MNDHEFERKLGELTAKVSRPDPTPAWKEDILARARQARETRAPRAPRWLLTALAAAWVLIALLRITTPEGLSVPGSSYRTVSSPAPVAAEQSISSLRHLLAMHGNADVLELP